MACAPTLVLRTFAAPIELRTPRVLLRQWKDSDIDAFAGFVGLNVPGFEAPWMPAVEIGWRLAPAAWHKGYATEGAAAALDFAFMHLELPQQWRLAGTPSAWLPLGG